MFGGPLGSDIWGWTRYDEESGVAVGHYALTCQTDGVSVVDITDPINPNVLAFVESNVSPIRHVNWRDMKGLTYCILSASLDVIWCFMPVLK